MHLKNSKNKQFITNTTCQFNKSLINEAYALKEQ
jgi:hypothetical protein